MDINKTGDIVKSGVWENGQAMPSVHSCLSQDTAAAFRPWSDSETVGQIDLYVAVAPHVVYEVLFVDIQKS